MTEFNTGNVYRVAYLVFLGGSINGSGPYIYIHIMYLFICYTEFVRLPNALIWQYVI